MRWRQITAMQESLQGLQTDSLPVYTHMPEDLGRSASLVEALARLEAATRLRDAEAVARILEGLAHTDDGQWLLRPGVAAGLREVAAVIADPGPDAGQSFGAA